MKAIDLLPFSVCTAETDLKIFAEQELMHQALFSVTKYRQQLVNYIAKRPSFLKSLKPLEQDFSAPVIVQHMIEVTQKVNVGPMAAVAGAIAQYLGKDLLKYSSEIIIENGGDIFMHSSKTRYMAVHSKNQQVDPVLEIEPVTGGQGICTSAGTLGHSLSYGNADAVVVRANDTLLADATATSIGNMVKTHKDINLALSYAKSVTGITGILITINKHLGAWGNIKFKE
ncbi:UPF0280 family protein [Clostridium sp. 'deep sea']|uniref:UPF0280 family protein n=1 Tax=Clostridium sp. 'deep sea' TaxID=2779445 RepID=UPI001896A472|nr:UPF0280 family protein [Clostridium sp. 'deep sea']QOR33655.1 UPF0280 family protein [Clostridium sp. 'deep sea']